MSRLRNRARRRLREPFGKAGLTVAICALVMALVGGAYAAGGLTKSQEKQVTKIAKKYAGKPGAPGTPGAAGTNGKDGAPGQDGAPGSDGKSVTVAAEAKGANCKEGGASFETEGSGTKKYACNGSPWTVGGTLPKEATETGVWAYAGGTESEPVSFDIPLKASIPPANVHVVGDVLGNSGEPEAVPPECENPNHPGLAGNANPEADPGHMCFFGVSLEIVHHFEDLSNFDSEAFAFEPGVGPTGTRHFMQSGLPGGGTWAVTAP
jgi:hypothetical protein